MSIALGHTTQAPRAFSLRHLATAFVLGGAITAAGALAIAMPRTTPVAATAPIDRSTTTAGEQYRSWFGRPSDLQTSSTTATRQYVSWYLRPVEVGSSTATEQYLDWYLRSSTTSEPER